MADDRPSEIAAGTERVLSDDDRPIGGDEPDRALTGGCGTDVSDQVVVHELTGRAVDPAAGEDVERAVEALGVFPPGFDPSSGPEEQRAGKSTAGEDTGA